MVDEKADPDVVAAFSNELGTQFLAEVLTPGGRMRSELFLITYEGDKLRIERVDDAPDGFEYSHPHEEIVSELVRQFVLLRQATEPETGQALDA